ncbi:hypothetical protein OJAV_G00134030 [Oryzias javanicus]|uniref:Uncharacterized protein n=1 Tax=Oryzias javanicus TaxID=123683 RepID=A0A437CQQ4_ORYJA|nr:hypothetical protein OJAV_G00134030 [Oryzias javanicus]
MVVQVTIINGVDVHQRPWWKQQPHVIPGPHCAARPPDERRCSMELRQDYRWRVWRQRAESLDRLSSTDQRLSAAVWSRTSRLLLMWPQTSCWVWTVQLRGLFTCSLQVFK